MLENLMTMNHPKAKTQLEIVVKLTTEESIKQD